MPLRNRLLIIIADYIRDFNHKSLCLFKIRKIMSKKYTSRSVIYTLHSKYICYFLRQCNNFAQHRPYLLSWDSRPLVVSTDYWVAGGVPPALVMASFKTFSIAAMSAGF